MMFFLELSLQVPTSMIDEDVVETPQFKSEPQPNIPSVDEDDDTMSYFQKLANE